VYYDFSTTYIARSDGTTTNTNFIGSGTASATSVDTPNGIIAVGSDVSVNC